MQDTTNEFSFILKPSGVAGIGVFATHGIAEGVKLALIPEAIDTRMMDKDSVPEEFQQYCIHREGDKLWCPAAFNHMNIGWYLNHSLSTNAAHRGGDYKYYAIRNIRAGEEISVDYNTLEEPEDAKDDFYSK